MAKYQIFLEHRDRVELFVEVWCLVIRYRLYDDNSYLVSLQKECSRVTADRWSWMSFPLLQAPRSSSIMQPIPVSAESSETAKITASQCSRISASEFSPRDSLIADTRAGRIFGWNWKFSLLQPPPQPQVWPNELKPLIWLKMAAATN